MDPNRCLDRCAVFSVSPVPAVISAQYLKWCMRLQSTMLESSISKFRNKDNKEAVSDMPTSAPFCCSPG